MSHIIWAYIMRYAPNDMDTYIYFYFIFNFSVYINPILLVAVDRSKINVGNIVGFSITIIAWIAIVAWVAIVARLF